MPELSHQVAETLRGVFGFHAFRPNQGEIIHALLEGQDVFAVMPTGGGKSLCYQLPAIVRPGICVVISPLISLMKDQVDNANSAGIKAAFWNSSLTPQEKTYTEELLKTEALDLLYVSPERMAMGAFQRLLNSLNINFFAVDEAHCISEWGHDFRPDYLFLENLKTMFPSTPVAAFTASATNRVQDDIIKKLRLHQPFTVRASFDRPNLFYQIHSKNKVENQILRFIKEHPSESGIVYRTTRKDVEGTADFLKEAGIKALPYHAGMEPQFRRKHQEMFNKDEVLVIVATIAFGMGIDKSNIRFIAHGDLPKNMEGYYQETGRAGRDGEPAICRLFYGYEDLPTIRFFISQMQSDSEQKVANEKLRRVMDFVSCDNCRRARLLAYFGENYSKDNCETCDICAGDAKQLDLSTEAQMFMSAIARIHHSFGINHYIDVLLGSNKKKIREFGHDQIKTHGVGRDHKRDFWRELAFDLINRECLGQTEDEHPTVFLTPKGKEVLFGRKEFRVWRRPQEKKILAPSKVSITHDYDFDLFERLRDLRREIAQKQNVPPYVVFNDRTLHEFCRHYPETKLEMMEVDGVGEIKFERYGVSFIDEINTYLTENPHLKEEIS